MRQRRMRKHLGTAQVQKILLAKRVRESATTLEGALVLTRV